MLDRSAILTGKGIAVTVCAYGASERQSAHRDRHSRVSFLLSGSYREEVSSASTCVRAGDVMLKSREAKHEVQFSEVGARIVSVEFADEDPFEGAPLTWGRRTDRFTLRHIVDVLAAARAGDINGAWIASMDLVTSNVKDECSRPEPPQWIRRLREALEESNLAVIDVRDWAIEAGYHPAHASRLFRRCFGFSISDYAGAHTVRRAIGHLASPVVSLSEVALAAGFYDQSHMNRSFRRILGRTPGATRPLLFS